MDEDLTTIALEHLKLTEDGIQTLRSYLQGAPGFPAQYTVVDRNVVMNYLQHVQISLWAVKDILEHNGKNDL